MLRDLVDWLWLAGFAASLAWLLSVRGGASSSRGEWGLLLELRPGVQQQALLRGGRRIGTLQQVTRRRGAGWELERRLLIDGGRPAALVRQVLRGDLSLARLSLEADLDRLPAVSGLVAPELLGLGGGGNLSVSGPCRLETGSCLLTGRAGKRALRFPVHPGRGPVLPAAVYPLLAGGRLGRSLDLSLFDALALRSRRVSVTVGGTERLELPAGEQQGLRVRVEVEGRTCDLWLDREGMPLREELLLGLRAEHEWWRPNE